MVICLYLMFVIPVVYLIIMLYTYYIINYIINYNIRTARRRRTTTLNIILGGFYDEEI